MCAHTHTHTTGDVRGINSSRRGGTKKKKDGTTEEEASPREVVNFTRKRFFSPLSLSRFSIVSDAAAVGHFGLFSHFDPSTTRSDQHKNGSDVAAASRPALVEGGNENAQLKFVRWLQADPCYSILFCSFFLYIGQIPRRRGVGNERNQQISRNGIPSKQWNTDAERKRKRVEK